MLDSLNPKPKRVIVIGIGVKNILHKKLDELGISYSEIPQPQAHIKGGYQSKYREYFDLCSTI
jgi:hypothetical protein